MSTHEQHQDSDPKQRLTALLEADFTSPEREALIRKAEQGDNALDALLARAISVEGIDARLASEENIELGRAVERLVESAPVTESFKEFIANEVRRAHAWQESVDDVVSPGRLGLLSSEGIFDPARAKDLEAQALRGRMFDVMNRYTTAFTIEDEDQTVPPQLILTGSARPSDYTSAVDVLDEWSHDYRETYDEDPLEDLDGEPFLDAGGRVAVPKGSGMAEYIKRLREAQGLGEE